MGPSHEEALEKRHASTTSAGSTAEPIKSPASSNGGSDEHAEDHDSLVTVRLSEPSALFVDTSVSNGSGNQPYASRKSMFGRLFSPKGAVAEVTKEEEDSRSSRGSSPGVELARNLHDELEKNERDSRDESIGPVMYDSDVSDPEEVDWEQLQKTEDEHSKDQDCDNVGRADHPLFTMLPGAPRRLTSASRLPSSWLGSSKRTPNSLSIRTLGNRRPQAPRNRVNVARDRLQWLNSATWSRSRRHRPFDTR